MSFSFNTEGLKNVKTTLSKSITNLESAKSIVSGTEVPDGFPKAGQFKNISYEIANVKTCISDINTWIDNAVSKLEILSKKNDNLLNDLFGTIANSMLVINSLGDFPGTEGITNNQYNRQLAYQQEANAAIGADILNGAIAFGSGILSVGEDLFDLGCIVGSAVASPFTFAYDAITGSTATGDMWNNTMAIVSYEWVQNGFNYLYDPYAEGLFGGAFSELDNMAHDIFKSTGAGFAVSQFGGKMAATVLLAIATRGLGTAAQGAKAAWTTSSTMAKVASKAKSVIPTEAKIAGATGYSNAAGSIWREQDQSERNVLSGLTGAIPHALANTALWTGAGKTAELFNINKIASLTGGKAVATNAAFNVILFPIDSTTTAVALKSDLVTAMEAKGGIIGVIGSAAAGGTFKFLEIKGITGGETAVKITKEAKEGRIAEGVLVEDLIAYGLIKGENAYGYSLDAIEKYLEEISKKLYGGR